MSTENVEDDETKQDSGVNPLLQKYEEYYEAVRNNPDDFQTWTYLLGTVERLDEIEKIIEVFDKFLAEYPLCYGYWKKYADASERHSGLHAAMSVYERGIQSVSYSVDLWSHYLTFQINKIGQLPDVVRSLFERGVAYIGHDYLSHLFWDKYFQFELDQREFRNLGNLYKRVMTLPIKELESYYGNFSLTVGDWPAIDCFCQSKSQFDQFAEHEISEVCSEEEIDSYLKQMMNSKNESSMETPGVDGDVQMEEEGTIPPPPKADSTLRSMDSFTDAEIKDYWIQCMAELYERTGKELTIRRQYEDCIKRPYFHVKALDGVQLQTWWKYLDYILSQEDTGQSIILFERCLVPCALYPEFWIRYILFLEQVSMEQAQYALDRAVQIFCKKKSEIHLFAARFYERQGNQDNARLSLELVTNSLTPTLLTGIIQQASFELRLGNPDRCCEIFEHKIQSEMENKDSEIVGFLTVQFAYVLVRRLLQKDKARSILQQVISERPDLLVLWEGSIQIEEIINEEDSIDRIQAIYKDSISEKGKALSEDDQATLSQRLLNFMDLFGTPELFRQAQSHYIEQFGSRKLLGAQSKRPSPFGVDSGFSKQPHLTSSSSGVNVFANPESFANQATTTTATSSAMAPQTVATAQQYAQYYSQFAAAAAAGYGSYSGYGSYTG